MKPPSFEYYDPRTVEEALGLLAEHGDEAKVLAGGQSLVPMLNFRLLNPSCLVDINRVEGLSGLRVEAGELIFGAAMRQRDLERSHDVKQLCPLLHEVLPHIGHFQIRNRGTIGGSLSHADPAAELPAAIAALDGKMVLRSQRGERVLTTDDFFSGYFSTDVGPDELLTEIRLPVRQHSSGSAFLEVSRRHGDFALVGVASCVNLNSEAACTAARIVLTGVHETPFRSQDAEQALVGTALGESDLKAASNLVTANLTPQSDIHASAEYRVHAARVLTARALSRAAQRARDSIGRAT